MAALAGAMADQFAAVAPQMDQPGRGWVAGPAARRDGGGAADCADRSVPSGVEPNLAQGLVAGLLLGIALALIRDATDRTVRTRETLDQVSGVPMLAALPKNGTACPTVALFEEAVREIAHPPSRAGGLGAPFGADDQSGDR